ncbi:MAG: EamA family transporter [Acidimicrobiales bacterium]
MLGVGFVLVGATVFPWTSAIVRPVFLVIGPSASSAWRFLIGAVVLLAFTRPRVLQWTRHQWIGALALGVSTAFMNMSFYQAIARIPLGSAVTIEFLGPLLVAVLGKRTWRHSFFALVAGFGVVALSHPGGGLTLEGGLFAVGAGVGWASYLFASHRVGGSTTGFGGLAVSMMISSLVTLPFSLGSTMILAHHPFVFARLVIVAVASIVIGFGAELQALRRLKPSIVGVLVSFEPAIAFGVGWILLSEPITGWSLVGLASVMIAGIGVTLDQARNAEPVPH